MDLNREQIAILDHTAHRAAGGYYCGDSPDMQALVAAGLMESAGRKSFVPDEYFRMTGKGREALRSANTPVRRAVSASPPVAGSQTCRTCDYLDSDGTCQISGTVQGPDQTCAAYSANASITVGGTPYRGCTGSVSGLKGGKQ